MGVVVHVIDKYNSNKTHKPTVIQFIFYSIIQFSGLKQIFCIM